MLLLLRGAPPPSTSHESWPHPPSRGSFARRTAPAHHDLPPPHTHLTAPVTAALISPASSIPSHALTHSFGLAPLTGGSGRDVPSGRLWKAHKQWETTWCDISLEKIGGPGAGAEERRSGRGVHGNGSLAEEAIAPGAAETAARSLAAG